MKFISGNIYHVFNQGNNHQPIFLDDKDYKTFLNYSEKILLPHCTMLAYCLMPNHFHFLLHANETCDKIVQQGTLLLDPLTNGFRKLLSGYARTFNDQHEKSGSLFRQKTKAKCLDDAYHVISNSAISIYDYYLNCFQYIHYNPVQAGLVLFERDWRWSSYRFYAGLENLSICNKEFTRSLAIYQENDFTMKSKLFDRKNTDFFEAQH